jgi:nitrite reductase/ring-hydroxylating ferredoxin subunit
MTAANEEAPRVVEIRASDIAEDAPVQVRLGNEAAIAVYRVGGCFYALDDVCTHEFAFLSEGFCEAGVIECPLHQARFDVRTGESLGPPASEPVAVYPVEVADGIVRVILPPPRGEAGKTS